MLPRRPGRPRQRQALTMAFPLRRVGALRGQRLNARGAQDLVNEGVAAKTVLSGRRDKRELEGMTTGSLEFIGYH